MFVFCPLGRMSIMLPNLSPISTASPFKNPLVLLNKLSLRRIISSLNLI